MTNRYQGRSAIVTGSGHGIGAAVASRLAAEGAAVLVCDLNESQAAAQAKAIQDKGGRAQAQVVDVRDRAQVEAAVAKATSAFGSVDVLVNVAGIMDKAPFLEMSDELWHRIIDINLYGTFLFGQAAARQMVAQGKGGHIINIASNSGVFGGRGRAAYGSSKAGVINLTQTMAIELAQHGIYVNAVAPGPTRTRVQRSVEIGSGAASRMVLKRFGEPEEIAAMVAFAASGEASFTAGHVLFADGGFTITGMMDG